MAKSIKQIIKELEEGTLRIKKRGKKYFVEDTVDYAEGGWMNEAELRELYG